MPNKKVVILGGSGFLGSHVADFLIKENFNVIIFDREQPLNLEGKYKFIKGDICDFKQVDSVIKNSDYVYNFSAIADIKKALENPILSAKVNILGNINALEASRKNKIKRFIYASTVYVFSDEGSFYRCTKKSSEEYVKEYYKRYKLNFSILRYGSLYGPRSDKTNFIYSKIIEGLKKKKITYEGSKDSLRSYVHVIDAAKLSTKILIDKKYNNKELLVTGHNQIKVVDLIEMLAEILKIRKNNIEFKNKKFLGHYIKSPYAIESNIPLTISSNDRIDLGQGLFDLINFIKKNEK